MAEFSEMTAHALSAEHFQRYPVWRFLGPEEASDPDADESCVLPHTSGVSLGDNASYLVSATFALESQQQLSGFVEVTVIGQQSQFIPGAVFAGGRAVEALSKEAAVRLERDPEEEGRTASLLGTRCPHLWRRQSPEGDMPKPGLAQALTLLVQLWRPSGCCSREGDAQPLASSCSRRPPAR